MTTSTMTYERARVCRTCQGVYHLDKCPRCGSDVIDAPAAPSEDLPALVEVPRGSAVYPKWLVLSLVFLSIQAVANYAAHLLRHL